MSNELAVIPLEQKVEQEFKLEIVKLIPDTEAAISKLKDNYMTIKVTDKASFKKADEARKDVKNVRVIGEKVCDQQRERLEAEKKSWIAKKKEWSGIVGEIETYLETQTDDWKQAEQKRKDEEAEKLEAEKKRLDLRLLERQQELGKFSVLFSDNTFMLGEVRYSYEKVREADDELYQNEIYPSFKAIFDQHEEERRQQELERQEAEEKQRQEQEQLRQEQEQLKKEQDEMKQQRFELRMDRLKALGLLETTADIAAMTNDEFQHYYNDVAERNEKERRRQKINSIFNDRFVELEGAGYNQANETIYDFTGNGMISKTNLADMPQYEWDLLVKNHNQHYVDHKAEEERKRQEEEEQKRVEKEKKQRGEFRLGLLLAIEYVFIEPVDLSALPQEDWDKLYNEAKAEHEQKKHEEWLEQERIKKQLEDERKAAQLAEAKDKEKWQEIMAHLEKTPILEMRSQQYRTKMKIVRDFLTDLKAK